MKTSSERYDDLGEKSNIYKTIIVNYIYFMKKYFFIYFVSFMYTVSRDSSISLEAFLRKIPADDTVPIRFKIRKE
jgi:hypothetical protein